MKSRITLGIHSYSMNNNVIRSVNLVSLCLNEINVNEKRAVVVALVLIRPACHNHCEKKSD